MCIRDSVYFVDFLCRLFSKENIPLCIYLVINMVIIGGIMSVLFVLPLQWGMLSGFFVYLDVYKRQGKKLPKGIRRKVDLEKNLRIHKG